MILLNDHSIKLHHLWKKEKDCLIESSGKIEESDILCQFIIEPALSKIVSVFWYLIRNPSGKYEKDAKISNIKKNVLKKKTLWKNVNILNAYLNTKSLNYRTLKLVCFERKDRSQILDVFYQSELLFHTVQQLLGDLLMECFHSYNNKSYKSVLITFFM